VTVVNADGTVGQISEARGPSVLVDDARETLKKWKFDPATRNGKPIAATLLFTFRYFDGKVALQEGAVDPAHYTQSCVRLSQAVLHTMQTKSVPPHGFGLRGKVVMKILLGTDGKVKEIKVVEGNPLINSSAEDAVRQWEYRPFRMNGQPVEVESEVTIQFNPY
jgi:TonB family protein